MSATAGMFWGVLFIGAGATLALSLVMPSAGTIRHWRTPTRMVAIPVPPRPRPVARTPEPMPEVVDPYAEEDPLYRMVRSGLPLGTPNEHAVTLEICRRLRASDWRVDTG